MNKLKTISLSLLLGMSLAGCEDILDENVNPDKGHSNTAKNGLPVVVFYAQQIVYDHAEYNVYLSQSLTTTGKSQTGSFPYRQGWEFINVNRHPQWRRHFYDVGVNARDLIENSKAINSPNYELIARTIYLMSTQLTTDTFGEMPMPVSEDIPNGECYINPTPHYETQPTIYRWMLNEADRLIAMYEDESIVNAPTNQDITVEMDRVYAGDLQKWKGLVYAVKARLLLRNIPNIDRSQAMCNQIIETAQKAIDAWTTGDLMYGEWFGNEPRYNFDGGTKTQNAPWSDVQPYVGSWPESRENDLDQAVPSKFLVEYCMGITVPGHETQQGQFEPANKQNGFGADPRLSLLFAPKDGPISASSTSTGVRLRYLENNIGSGNTFKIAHYPSLYMGAYASSTTAYNPIFTMEELYFIQAEAYYWKGDQAKACELTKEATKWNIQRHLEAYLAMNGGLYPTGKDGVASDNVTKWERWNDAFFEDVKTGRTQPVSAIGQKRYFFNSQAFSLSDLMTQKYIAMYMQPEQWTDMRRYHYSNDRNGIIPEGETTPVYRGLRRPYNLYSAYWVDGLTGDQKEKTWVQRLNYDPQTEDLYNPNELIRLGAYKDYKWLQKPMIWALEDGERASLTAE